MSPLAKYVIFASRRLELKCTRKRGNSTRPQPQRAIWTTRDQTAFLQSLSDAATPTARTTLPKSRAPKEPQAIRRRPGQRTVSHRTAVSSILCTPTAGERRRQSAAMASNATQKSAAVDPKTAAALKLKKPWTAQNGPIIRAIAPIAKVTPIQAPWGASPKSLPSIARHTPRPNGKAMVMRVKAKMNCGRDGGSAMSAQPKVAHPSEQSRSGRSPTRGAGPCGPSRGADATDRPIAHKRLSTPAAMNSTLAAVASHPNQDCTNGVVIVSWIAKPLKWTAKKPMQAHTPIAGEDTGSEAAPAGSAWAGVAPARRLPFRVGFSSLK
eukprot:scaffold9150_cov120-Isochrysis_galbana.AAC.18